MISSKLNIHLSTFNFVLCFVGYALATSLLLPMSTDIEGISRTVTVPYRAFTLAISLLVFFINFQSFFKINTMTKWLVFFWVLLLCRMFYDLELRTDFFVNSDDKQRVWLFAVAVCFTGLLSVISSIRFINLERAFFWVFIGYSTVSILQLFFNSAVLNVEIEERLRGGAGIATLAFGHYAGATVIVALTYYYRNRTNRLRKYIAVALILIGIFILLRSGSRGPLLSILGALLFFGYSVSRNKTKALLLALIGFVSFIFVFDYLQAAITDYFPVMYRRVMVTIEEGHMSGRDFFYQSAINIFLDNPLFGGQFCLLFDGSAMYSHNFIIDAFMGLGLFGGILFCFIYLKSIGIAARQIILEKENLWIFLILIQRIMAGMTSSAFYYDQLLTILLGFIFMKYAASKKTII